MYEERHERVLDILRKGTRHHLKGNFSDTDFSHGDNNMWHNSLNCVFHGKGEDFYKMFKEEVRRHVKDNIMSKIKYMEEMDILDELASSWKKYRSTISTFAKLFRYLELWTKRVAKAGIKIVGLKAFEDGMRLDNEISSVWNKRSGKNLQNYFLNILP